jgi:hypothetical protein
VICSLCEEPVVTARRTSGHHVVLEPAPTPTGTVRVRRDEKGTLTIVAKGGVVMQEHVRVCRARLWVCETCGEPLNGAKPFRSATRGVFCSVRCLTEKGAV